MLLSRRNRNRNYIGRIYCSHKSRWRSKQSRSGCSSVLRKVLTRVTAVSPEKEFLSVSFEIETVTSKHKKIRHTARRIKCQDDKSISFFYLSLENSEDITCNECQWSFNVQRCFWVIQRLVQNKIL